ncbi:TRAP transporter large permease [uncultured Brevibacterium sp.]|uniref:TRAP transporter large permease n=1 Tax=uncultured Brevibacterium sp. TaxID=189678 RepID=UPI0025CE3064|nr:TRAP transporter large permease [uncultured Brevibacterium sp.]
MIVVVITLLLLALILLRVPIAFAIFIAGFVGLIAVDGFAAAFAVFQVIPTSAAGKFSLSAIPLFILMAHFVLASGALGSLFESARIIVGRVRGGTGIAAVLAGAGFASVSGSSTASAATLAHTSTGEMIRQGYSKRLATGVVASAGTLAAMIPPSILLIFYAITAETSVGQTLLAGLVPGVLVALALCLVVYVQALRGQAPAAEGSSFREKFRALAGILPIGILFLVVGAVFFGITTATEAAAGGALGALGLMVVYRKATWKNIRESFVGTVTSSAMIMLIIVAAHVFGHFLAESRVTPTVVAAVGAWEIPSVFIMIGIVFVYLVLGFFMDQMAIIALTVPVTLPLVEALGYDPIWFGIVVILVAEIGLITPPLGLNAFVTARASRIPLETVFIGTVPFILGMLAVVVLVFAFPQIALFIPELMSE